MNPVWFAVWPQATQMRAFFKKSPPAFKASQLLFQNPAKTVTGRTKTHNDPGFSDNICFLLQLGCHCLDFHKHSAVWGVTAAKGCLPLIKHCFLSISKVVPRALTHLVGRGSVREADLAPASQRQAEAWSRKNPDYSHTAEPPGQDQAGLSSSATSLGSPPWPHPPNSSLPKSLRASCTQLCIQVLSNSGLLDRQTPDFLTDRCLSSTRVSVALSAMSN